MLAKRSPQMSKAVGVLKELSADERTRMLYEQREIARRDMVSRMEGARREAIAETTATIALNFLNLGIPMEQIAEATGLTCDEIGKLRNAS